jgi:hypothetical protein
MSLPDQTARRNHLPLRGIPARAVRGFNLSTELGPHTPPPFAPTLLQFYLPGLGWVDADFKPPFWSPRIDYSGMSIRAGKETVVPRQPHEADGFFKYTGASLQERSEIWLWKFWRSSFTTRFTDRSRDSEAQTSQPLQSAPHSAGVQRATPVRITGRSVKTGVFWLPIKSPGNSRVDFRRGSLRGRRLRLLGRGFRVASSEHDQGPPP